MLTRKRFLALVEMGLLRLRRWSFVKERECRHEPTCFPRRGTLYMSFLIPQCRPKPRPTIVIDQLVKGNHVWDEIPAPRESR